jgi:hypothetical protein
MTSAHEPVLHALSVEPRVARPGETVCVIFRTRNLGTSASPAGTVEFLLGDGFDALDEPAVAVDSVAPGEDVTAMMRARIAAPCDDRSELTAQAVLRVPNSAFGTNACTMVVRSRPVLDGAASGTFVEAIGVDCVRVRAVVTNEGDGAARDVRIDVPAPVGCVRIEDQGPATFAIERLDVGASATFAFDVRIVEPVAVIQADEGEVRCGDGRRGTLAPREVIMMEPVIVAPCVEVRPARRSVDVAVEVRNDGWADARDVRVRIALPAPVRAIDGSIAVDGVPVAVRGVKRAGTDAPFARLERSGGAHVVVLNVQARRTARIALTATLPRGYSGGAIVATAGPYEIVASFEPELVRDVRMRVTESPRFAAPDAEVRVTAELVNAGDVPETLFFCITGSGVTVAPRALSHTVAPGSVAVVELAARTHETARDLETLFLSVVACDAERERARSECTVVVRERPAPNCEEPAADMDADCLAAVVHAALRGPDEVSAGAAFTLHAHVDVEDPVELLTVRVRDIPGAAYVPGSTTLDGRALLDRAGISPLTGEGLQLRGVPAGTRITAAWTLLAHPSVCDEALIAQAVLDVDGREHSCEPFAVRARGRDAFAAQPAGLAYHVDACVVGESQAVPTLPAITVLPDVAPLPAHDDAFTFALRLERRRAGEVARLLETANGGLVTHVLALRMLLPDCETSGHPGVAAALDGVRCALHDVCDRLFVKLRIPGFDIACDDVEDVVLRSAMIGLFERLLDAPPGRDCGEDATTRITRERVRELLEAFADEPYGSPAALRALVALLPARCHTDPALSAALTRYACAFDDVLARYEGAPLELFDDALARTSDRALDDARAALAAALRECAPFAELAC